MWMLVQPLMWFFGALLSPLAAGVLSIVPAIGTCCLLAGVIWTFVRPGRELLWSIAPFVVSEAMLAVGALLWEKVDSDGTTVPLSAFLALQTAVIGFVTYRARRRLIAALFFAVFNATYALWAAFVAGMAMTGSWL